MKFSKTSIMFTDIVGYSSMVNKDESHALELLQIHDDIIEPIIRDNKGILIKKIGDAIFAEFPSAEACCKTAVKAQSKLNERNSFSNLKDKITIRIGLHTGKVIRKDNDLFGHDVNLCSRIESKASSGSIAASLEFMNELKGKSFLSREIGYVKLKNILNPKQLHKIYISKDDYNSETSKILYDKSIDRGIDIVDIDSYTTENSFSIGILYVNNIGDKNDENIAYNIGEELINDLGYINEVRTPSFNKVLNYKDTNLGYDDIARKLEVDYILSSNILKKDNVLKFSCELLDINTGNVLWSDSFKESFANIKSIRMHITKGVLNKFKVDFPEKLIQLYSNKLSNNDEAIELYYKGKYCYNYLQSNDDISDGIKYIEKSLSLDEYFIEAITIYGMLLHKTGNFELAESNLLKAQEIANDNKYLQGLSDIYKALQVIYSDKGQYNKALMYIEKSLKIQVQLNNNIFEAMIRIDYANLLNHIGKPNKSIEQNKKAISLLETMDEDRLIGISNAVLFNTHYTLIEYADSIKCGIKALRIFRKLDMKNFEGKILAIIGEAYCRIGNYSKMQEYIKDAEPIANEFNDLFLLGKINFLKSEHSLKMNEFEVAKDYLDKSIEWYDLSDNYVYKIEIMVEKLKLLIEENNTINTKDYLKKVQIQMKRIKGQYDDSLIDIIEKLISYADGNTLQKIDFKELKHQDNSKKVFIHWYIARILHDEDRNISKKHHEKSKELLNKISKKLSKKDKDNFNSTYYNKKILGEIEKPLDNKIENQFSFCPKCGCENSDNFAFCPKCGSKFN